MTKLQRSVFELHLRGFTGKLTLSKDQLQKTIYFKKGNPVYVSSTVRNEMLGQILVEQGKLNEEQFAAVLQAMSQTKKRQGEIIVELGFMTACQVYESLKEQAERKFENCLLFEDAEVKMEPGEEHLEGVPDLTIEMFRIFLDLCAVHGLDDPFTPPANQAPVLTLRGAEYLKGQALRPNESRAIRLFDGSRTAEEILADPDVDTSAAELLLGALHALGFIEFRDPAPRKFARSAAQIHSERKESSATTVVVDPPRQTVTIDPKEPVCSNDLPIYSWALRLDRPLTELLHVGVTTTKLQIRKTYEAFVRDLHLDSIAQSYEQKDRKIAEDVFNRLTLAYTILSDDKRRHEYVNDMAQRKPPKDPTKGIAAEVHLHKAKVLMGKKQFAQAEKEIQSAIELVPEESAYYVALADLGMRKASAEKVPFPPTIEAVFKKALSLNPTDLTALFQYGLFAKMTSDFEKAKSLFSKILETSPNHAQTLSELRLVNQRLESKKKGSFLNIFKKK